MDDAQKCLERYFKNRGRIYIKIDDEISLNKIYELFINKVMFEPINDIETFYLGRYYHIFENYNMAKKYYTISANNNNHNSMAILSNIFVDDENYKLAKQYHLMSINNIIEDVFSCEYYYIIGRIIHIELYMNNMKYKPRDTFMEDLNYCANTLCNMSQRNQKKFIQLVKNFDFMENDILGEELKKLIKN